MTVSSTTRLGHVAQKFSNSNWYNRIQRFAALCPRAILRRLAGALGSAYGKLPSKNVRILERNLALVAKPGNRPGPASAVYKNFGMVLSDYFYLATRSRTEALDLIDERVGYEHLKAAYQCRKGVLLITAHFGFFELGGLLMTELGFPTVALTLPELNQELTEWRRKYRARWGVDTIEVGKDEFAFASIGRELRQGRFVAALIDRPSGSYNNAVTMPGGTIHCSGGILILAILTGCPVVTVAVITKPNRKYRVEAHAPLFFPKSRATPEIVTLATQRVMDNLTPVIKAHPEQWFQFVPLQQPR